MTAPVLFETKADCLDVILNRPEEGNLITNEMGQEIARVRRHRIQRKGLTFVEILQRRVDSDRLAKSRELSPQHASRVCEVRDARKLGGRQCRVGLDAQIEPTNWRL